MIKAFENEKKNIKTLSYEFAFENIEDEFIEANNEEF